MFSDSSSSPLDVSSPISSSSLATTPNYTQSELKCPLNFTTITSNPYPTKTAGVSLSCRVNASVTVTPNSKNEHSPQYIYVFGGFHQYTDEVYNDLYRLNIAEMKWEDVIYLKGNRPSKRTNHSASLWNKDKLLIFGGTDVEDQYCDDVHILDLKTMTWECPEIHEFRPNGRAKHTATISNDKLYIIGGYTKNEYDTTEVSSYIDCLNLRTWRWETPIKFVPRHSHVSFIFRNRVYAYGGYNEEMDREKSLDILDLQTNKVSKIQITCDIGPEINGQHFAQLYCNQLVLVITQCVKHDAQEVSIGVWSLDLDSLQWHKFEDGERFVQGKWHYFAMAENNSHFFLFGNPEEDSDEYFSNVLSIDLQEYGISRIPPTTIGWDFQQLINDEATSDFVIRSKEPKSPPFHVHRIILIARWSHFSNMINSGMLESYNKSLTIPESYKTVQAFVSFLYTDVIDDQFSVDTIADLMILGNMYLIPRLKSLCCACLQSKINIDNVSRIYQCASVAEIFALKKRCMRFININFGPVSRTQGFRSLPKEILFDFLDNLPDKAKINTTSCQIPSGVSIDYEWHRVCLVVHQAPHGKEAISGATGIATGVIASKGSKIIETTEDTINETKGVIGYAARKGKEVATHPIYYMQKSTSFFWEKFPPLSWFTYGVIALNAIPLTILLIFLFITTSIVALVTGTGIFLAEGFFVGVGSFFLIPVFIMMIFASFVTAFFTIFGWTFYKLVRSILHIFDLIEDDDTATLSFDAQQIFSKTSEVLTGGKEKNGREEDDWLVKEK
ncbi:22126_t:CDS:2 [Entrophospora sp. SA101]|nr:22126_t:CDS:2 [Entrophospora sp. SA101]